MSDFSGFEHLRDEIEDYQEKVAEARVRVADADETAAENTAENFQNDVKKTIKQKGLTDSGELANSIQVTRVDDNTFKVFTNADHALYLEYGTDGPITASDEGDNEYLKFEDESGNTIFRKAVSGVSQKVFWRKNERVYIAREALSEELNDEIERAIEEVFG